MRPLLLSLLFLLLGHAEGATTTPVKLTDLRGVWQADWNEDGSRVVAWLRDGRTGIWEVATGQAVVAPVEKPAHAGYLLSDDRKSVLICGPEGVRAVEMKSGTPRSPALAVETGELSRTAFLFSPDGQTLVELAKSEVVVRRVSSGETLAKHPLFRNEETEGTATAVFTKEGREFLVMDGKMAVTKYDTGSWQPRGKPLKHPPAPLAYDADFAASADGRWIATYDSPGENGPKGFLQLWDGATGTPLGRRIEAQNGLTAQFIPGTNRVVVLPARGKARVLELPSLKVVRTLRTHDELEGPRVQPALDGKHLFVWGSDNVLDYCDPGQEKLAGVYISKAHLETVLQSPDGAFLYLACDNTAFFTLGHHDHYVLKLKLPELNVVGSLRTLDVVGQVFLSPEGSHLMIKQGWDDREQLLFYDAQTMKPLE